MGGCTVAAVAYISQWGTSLALRIPKTIAQQWGVQKGSAIEISPEGDMVVLRKRTYDLDAMVAQITPENLHKEQDTGPAQGAEAW